MTRCLIVGLGSIGRRHLRNLRQLGLNDFVLVRAGRGTINDPIDLAGCIVVSDLQAGLELQPTLAIVANPTALHIQTALACAQAGCHLLIEKPVSHDLHGCDALLREVAQRGLTAGVGFQLRFHPGLLQVKAWLDQNAIGAPVSAQAHWGEYLPDWHPWEDYRLSYSARADLGGGVALTLCHPYDYMRWLLGEAQDVSSSEGRMGGLQIEVEDTSDAHLRLAGGVLGHVHVNYIQRPFSHWLQIVGQQGTIRWDAGDGAAHCYRAQAKEWVTVAPPDGHERNDLFLDEMRNFLRAVDGHEPLRCSLADGITTLRLVLAVRESARLGTRVTLQEGDL